MDEASGLATRLQWGKDEHKDAGKESSLGVYFLPIDLNMRDEAVVWNMYTTIRENESSFRCLKTDLDLRPAYHQNDDNTMAHLHLGILAYWLLVNILRHQFKAKGVQDSWSELVRIGNTQKGITTTAQNPFDQTIRVRKCSESSGELKQLYDILHTKPQPFRKRKSEVHNPAFKNAQIEYLQAFTPSKLQVGLTISESIPMAGNHTRYGFDFYIINSGTVFVFVFASKT